MSDVGTLTHTSSSGVSILWSSGSSVHGVIVVRVVLDMSLPFTPLLACDRRENFKN